MSPVRHASDFSVNVSYFVAQLPARSRSFFPVTGDSCHEPPVDDFPVQRFNGSMASDAIYHFNMAKTF